jgi:hypothetical protein
VEIASGVIFCSLNRKEKYKNRRNTAENGRKKGSVEIAAAKDRKEAPR